MSAHIVKEWASEGNLLANVRESVALNIRPRKQAKLRKGNQTARIFYEAKREPTVVTVIVRVTHPETVWGITLSLLRSHGWCYLTAIEDYEHNRKQD